MQFAIGGEFEAFGFVEKELLRYAGLKKNDYLIDVGCGAGRLSKPLAEFLEGSYLGTDIVPELVSYAKKATNRPDWRFQVVRAIEIPEKDGKADFVCFFSVLTHLTHEQSYKYLREAKRVLKSGGKIVFSFLEFQVACHWDVFAASAKNGSNNHPLNAFLSRDAIQAFAQHLDLQVELIEDGDKPFIPLSHAVTLDSGVVMERLGNLGQSVCILTR
jgi:ubiquinone/menaquinone biosynthesis C-methylase UbiE